MNAMSVALDALGIRLPSPGWTVLDAIRSRRFTGQLTLIGVPPTKLWADQGRIYRAETLGAPPLAARLVVNGGLTADDLARGVVRVGGREHLGALFERAPLADRHAILLALATMTEEALRAIAGQHIAAATIEPYVFDPEGVHLWATAPTGATAPAASTWAAPAAPSVSSEPTPAAAPPAPAVPAAWASPAPVTAPPAPPTNSSASAATPPQPAPAPPPAPPVAAPPPVGVAPTPTLLAAPTTDAMPATEPAPGDGPLPEFDWDRIPFLDGLNDGARPNGVRPAVGSGQQHQPAPCTNGHSPAGEPPAVGADTALGDELDTGFAVIWPDGDRRPTGDDVVDTPRAPNPLAELAVGARGRLFDDRFGPLSE